MTRNLLALVVLGAATGGLTTLWLSLAGLPVAGAIGFISVGKRLGGVADVEAESSRMAAESAVA